MGKLFSALKTRGAFDNSVIAVMADHGEAFGEHGENHHGIFLYDETIHVPMLFKLPGRHTGGDSGRSGWVGGRNSLYSSGGSFAGSRRGSGQIPDEIHGIRHPNGFAKAERCGFATPGLCGEPLRSASFGWSTLKAWRTGKYLYVDAPERELFDLSAGPNGGAQYCG